MMNPVIHRDEAHAKDSDKKPLHSDNNPPHSDVIKRRRMTSKVSGFFVTCA
jgi:hypothetical protein